MTAAELQAFVDALPVAAVIMHDRRILACNRHLAELAAVPLDELLATEDPIERFVAPEDQPVVLGRIAARARGDRVPAELDYVGMGGNGERIPSRAHVAPFPSAGEHTVLVVITHEGLRARSASLIRGFIDVAVAAQRESTQAGILRVAREGLERLGLSATLCELGPGCFRVVEAGSGNPFIAQIQQRWPDWIPDSAFPMPRSSTEGMLIPDLPAVLAAGFGRARDAFLGAPPAAMVTSIPIDGVPTFLISCSGSDLDVTIANAFGLLGKQFGAALETVRRLEELDRRNSELRAQAEEMTLLNDVARRVAGSFEVGPLLELGGETLRRLLDADRWIELLPDPREPALHFHVRAPEGANLRLGEESVAMAAFRERRVVQVLDPRRRVQAAASARSTGGLLLTRLERPCHQGFDMCSSIGAHVRRGDPTGRPRDAPAPANPDRRRSAQHADHHRAGAAAAGLSGVGGGERRSRPFPAAGRAVRRRAHRSEDGAPRRACGPARSPGGLAFDASDRDDGL